MNVREEFSADATAETHVRERRRSVASAGGSKAARAVLGPAFPSGTRAAVRENFAGRLLRRSGRTDLLLNSANVPLWPERVCKGQRASFEQNRTFRQATMATSRLNGNVSLLANGWTSISERSLARTVRLIPDSFRGHAKGIPVGNEGSNNQSLLQNLQTDLKGKIHKSAGQLNSPIYTLRRRDKTLEANSSKISQS